MSELLMMGAQYFNEEQRKNRINDEIKCYIIKTGKDNNVTETIIDRVERRGLKWFGHLMRTMAPKTVQMEVVGKTEVDTDAFGHGFKHAHYFGSWKITSPSLWFISVILI